MPSLTCFHFRFTPNWPMIILAALFISLFMRLGFWQIHRADEKMKMVSADEVQAKQEPIGWKTDQKMPFQYQRVMMQGHYLHPIFLLDNQHHQHQFGYDILSPFVFADGSVVVVDRGWVPGDSMRQAVPQIAVPRGLIQLQGSAYFPSINLWILGPDLEKKENQITILERMDTQLMGQLLQKKVYPFIIRLDKRDAYGFVREWAIVSMPAERHLAYAVQWFVMALVILIIFVALNLKKKK